MASRQARSQGIGFFGLVFIVFLVMKLAGIGVVANWSWWWVTSPLWLPTALYFGFFGGLAIMGLIVVIIAVLLGKK